jgi:hypothetical protein
MPMPSPFPGMDPYLEAPERWSGVHGSLIFALREQLSPLVRPRFFVAAEESVTIVSPDDPTWRLVRPDIVITERALVSAGRHDTGRISQPRLLERPQPLEVRTRWLTVRDVQERRVVATIELLSPANKVVGSRGYNDFVSKREQVMQSSVHWLEIDLLRAGTRPPEVMDLGAYYALLHRADAGNIVEAWFAGLRDPLPIIAVPLVDDLPDVPLDLQTAVATLYDRYAYDVILDYTQPPPAPPLLEADAAWAAERVAAWRGEHLA